MEKGEFQLSTIENISKDFFADVYFVKYVLEKLSFMKECGKILSFKEILNELNVMQQGEFIRDINLIFWEQDSVHEILRQTGIEKEKFFETTDNSIHVNGRITLEREEISRSVIGDLEIRHVCYEVQIYPFRISLPLNHSMSVFDGDNNSNKKYRAFFGTEEESVELGYIEKKVHIQVNLKNRKHFGFIGMDTHINTIFPDEDMETEVDGNSLWKSIPQFDFSRLK